MSEQFEWVINSLKAMGLREVRTVNLPALEKSKELLEKLRSHLSKDVDEGYEHGFIATVEGVGTFEFNHNEANYAVYVFRRG